MRFSPRALFSSSIHPADVWPDGPWRARAPQAANRALPRAIVIGFVGGFIRHDNRIHGESRSRSPAQGLSFGRLYEVFENHRGEQAHQLILRLLDTDHDGSLSAEEKKNAHIIIYGHSWGGSETVALARALERDGIPVLLTIQWIASRRWGE